MIRAVRILACILAAGLLMPGLTAGAQQPEAGGASDRSAADAESGSSTEEQEAKDEAQRYRWLPIPIIITEPAIGKGLALSLTLFHPVKSGKKADRERNRVASLDSIGSMSGARQAPPVVTAVAGAYTDSRSWLAGVGHFNNWRNDSIRYAGGLATAGINSTIYLANLPIGFSMDTDIVYQDVKFRLGDSDFLLGTALTYMSAENTFGVGMPEDARFSSSFHNVGLAAKASWETRDSMMHPRSGQLAQLDLWRYDEAIGGDFDYWNARLKLLSFHSLSEQLTLGLRLDVAGVDGLAPFFAVPYVKLRGVPALRYQNKVAGAAEAELRYLLSPKWELSAFGGAGYVSDDIPIYENPGSIYNFGLGGRYQIFEAHDVWVGLDIARGPEEWNWYIQVGHPW